MAKPKKMDEVKTGEEQVCKECNRPYYWGYYYPPQQQAKESKKYFGAPAWVWAIIVVVIIIVVMFVLAIFSFISLFGPTEDTETRDFDVIVADGGHYRYTLGYFYNEDVELDLDIDLVNGSNFDVYIMDKDQYESAYGKESELFLAFAAIHSHENVGSLSEKISVPSGDGELYLVIDNSDNPLSEYDADPQGPVFVHVEIEVTTIFYFD